MPSVGVPASAPVPDVKVTPGGNVPDCMNVGAGVPEAVTLKVPELPTVKVVEVALVKAGAMMRFSVKFAVTEFGVKVLKQSPPTKSVFTSEELISTT